MKITPVVMCGGSGTRLWPLSRKSYPKQFARLVGDGSLLEQTLARFAEPSFGAPVVITSEPFRFVVTALTAKTGAPDATVIVEPSGRNTAPAALAAALYLHGKDPDALMLVAPSDHAIGDPAAFHAAVRAGVDAALGGSIVTFGIRPDRPHTGYGYLELETAQQSADTAAAVTPVARFMEKPDIDTAEAIYSDGRHLWNSGMFLCTAAQLVRAFEHHAPDFMDPVRRALAGAQPDLDFLRLAADPWGQAPSRSIDYAVMELADNIMAVSLSAGWADLGDWAGVWQQMEPDARGVATSGGATAIDCTDTLLRSDSDGLEVVGIGLDNVVVVAMSDAVLVAAKDRTQEVKDAVDILKAKSARQAEQLPRDFRPWGWYESLALGDRFQVKRIVVDPGGTLSLQSHVHRAEHWIVVEGTARVTVGEEVKLLTENQSAYIPLGAVHRLENPGKLPLVLIEVQTGAYLEEDDIVRYTDIYSRE